jgi:hypothetical protein
MRAGASLTALLLALLAAGLALGFRPGAGQGAHLSGDGAPALAARLGDLVVAAAPEDAALRVVLLRRRETLRHLPGLAAACGHGCRAQAVTVLRPSASGRVATLLLDASILGGGDALDAGRPLPDAAARCLADEVRRMQAGGEGCAGLTRAWRIHLPGFGGVDI